MIYNRQHILHSRQRPTEIAETLISTITRPTYTLQNTADDQTSAYPRDEAVADVLRVAGVLLQLLQERVAVEVQNLLHVAEENVRLVPNTCTAGSGRRQLNSESESATGNLATYC